MGQSMKEAMAGEGVVVGANIGGVPEAIDDGHSGLLFEPDDPDDLVRVLERLCNDAPLRQEMGTNGRRIAEEKFGAEIAANQTLELFDRVVRERPNALSNK